MEIKIDYIPEPRSKAEIQNSREKVYFMEVLAELEQLEKELEGEKCLED